MSFKEWFAAQTAAVNDNPREMPKGVPAVEQAPSQANAEPVKTAPRVRPMTERTTRKTVNFSKPFFLGADGEVFPAGQYVVETDEELLEPLSFTAYRRVATIIHIRSGPGISRALTIKPGDLDDALMNDRAPLEITAAQPGQMLANEREMQREE